MNEHNVETRHQVRNVIEMWVSELTFLWNIFCVHHYDRFHLYCEQHSITAKDFLSVPHLPETVQLVP